MIQRGKVSIEEENHESEKCERGHTHMHCSHAQLEYLAGLTQQKVHRVSFTTREELFFNYVLVSSKVL